MIVIVMGVLGSGKTTIGSLLAQQLGWEFADADSFHPPENIEKMRSGRPLGDADREPWLKAIHSAISEWLAAERSVVLACSALKRSYREQLVIAPEVRLVYLKGTQDVISRRVHARFGHFATEKLLASQFADLEEPSAAIVVDVDQAPEEIVAQIRRELGA